MKSPSIIIFVLVILIGCRLTPDKEVAENGPTYQIKKEDKIESIENEYVRPKGHEKCYLNEDSISIRIDRQTIETYTKEEYNDIVDYHPELYDYKYPKEPLILYEGLESYEMFGSEAGQDSYFVMYAHFLKQKNGEKKYRKQREQLVQIYRNINSLFGSFQYGGTYFGHQYYRVLGYAEYSVYLYSHREGDFKKNYDISKQKQLYIESLRQLIEDEVSVDYNMYGPTKESNTKEKIAKRRLDRVSELNEIVDEIEKNITDLFYLRRAQEFHHLHYEYY